MDKLNILFVSEYFWPRIAGGEIWSFGLMQELSSRGHNVTVVTGKDDPALKNAEDLNSMRIIRIDHLSPGVLERKRFQAVMENFLFRLLKKEKFDIIHAMAYLAALPAKKAANTFKIPLIVSVHSYFGNDWNKIKPWPMRLIFQKEERRILRSLDCTLQVPSSYLAKKIKKDTEKDCKIIYNWIDFNRIKTIRNEHHSKKNYSISVGSLEKIKNHEETIYNIPKKQKLVIVGEGSRSEELESIAKSEGKDVEFKGKLDIEETYRKIRDANKLINNSFNESYGYVIIEALLLGTTVETTNVGIVSDIVNQDVKKKSKKVTLKPNKKMSLQGLPVMVKRESAERFERLYSDEIKNHTLKEKEQKKD